MEEKFMKRIFAAVLVLLTLMSICSSVFPADPKTKISRWILVDGSKSFLVKPVALPKALYVKGSQTSGKLSINDLALEMNIEDAMPYADWFYKGKFISTLILYGVNTNDQPVLKITLLQSYISAFTTGKLFAGTLKDLTKASLSFRAMKLTTQKVNVSSPAPIKLSTPAGKLNIGKIYLDNTLLSDTRGISEIKGETGENSHISSGGGGSSAPEYSIAQFDVNYNSTGSLPDWLASIDTQKINASYANLSHKLKYELTSSSSGNKLIIYIEINITGQELIINESGYAFCNYYFQTTKISTGNNSDSAAVTKQKTTANSWSGKWDTTYGLMTLVQSESSITGNLGEQGEFDLKGTDSLGTLTGTWSEGTNEGSFQFIMAVDGKSFKGYMIDPALGSEEKYEWNGEKI